MIVYGHRGAKGEAPENTLPGFRHAYRHGIRHFELDLVLSKDGIPVLVHDLTVNRTTGHEGSVCNYTTAELAAMDARRNTSSWPRKIGIPTLEDLLDEFDDLEHLQLEVKKDDRQRLNKLSNRLTELIQHRNLYQKVAITSSDTWKLCSKDLVESAHRKGLHVSTWTVNRIHDMLELEAMGVNSIITDFPTSTRMYFDNRAKSLISLPEKPEALPVDKEPVPTN